MRIMEVAGGYNGIAMGRQAKALRHPKGFASRAPLERNLLQGYFDPLCEL